jgi:hypothetical protein
MNTNKDDPLLLLNKPSYKTVVLKIKPNHLNTLCAPCCYTQETTYKVYKWIPYDAKDITLGQSGKRILKLKEKSGCLSRCITPIPCRGYESTFIAENTRKVVFAINKPMQPSCLWFNRPESQVFYVK